ncbi:hypothetical protein TGAM01_v201266 [Trichoderma gamsii]|uniref:Uncharacterized protein n=1 Tax=Trichoderma gamsii TaxID=398673 RepID=A0A2P5A027_9HYPO|nr:hypothetical protein TGAM01_v201266 [Trichoderma gamsii]PON29900.1 hypothetical protein TGAM01_v201266 [Trichoderma gamsii]
MSLSHITTAFISASTSHNRLSYTPRASQSGGGQLVTGAVCSRVFGERREYATWQWNCIPLAECIANPTRNTTVTRHEAPPGWRPENAGPFYDFNVQCAYMEEGCIGQALGEVPWDPPRKRNAMQINPRAVGQTPNASEGRWASSCIAKKWEKLEKGRTAVRCSASLVHMFILTSRLALSGEMAK